MDGHGDGEYGIGNVVSINMLARWKVIGGKVQLWGLFYELYGSLNNVLYT